MIYLVTAIHVIVCFFLIVVVLLQSGKSADIAATFGGMGSQTAFGPRGAATVLSKATTAAAILFMITSITLSIVASKRSGPSSILEGVQQQQQTTPNPNAQPQTTQPVESQPPATPPR
jgi:preprotein translocase subunit SecG